MITLLALLILISPIASIILGYKWYKAYKAGEEFTDKKKTISIMSFILTGIFILAMCGDPNDNVVTKEDTDNTITEEYTVEEEEEETVIKPDPIDTSNIHVYVSLYNGGKVYANTAHSDYDCGMCRKEVFGDPLEVIRVNAKELSYNYSNVKFCPICSPYSDYYVSGEPR